MKQNNTQQKQKDVIDHWITDFSHKRTWQKCDVREEWERKRVKWGEEEVEKSTLYSCSGSKLMSFFARVRIFKIYSEKKRKFCWGGISDWTFLLHSDHYSIYDKNKNQKAIKLKFPATQSMSIASDYPNKKLIKAPRVKKNFLFCYFTAFLFISFLSENWKPCSH